MCVYIYIYIYIYSNNKCMCVFIISPVPITEPLTSELIDTPVFHNLAPRPIKYRVSIPIPSYRDIRFWSYRPPPNLTFQRAAVDRVERSVLILIFMNTGLTFISFERDRSTSENTQTAGNGRLGWISFGFYLAWQR